MRASIVLVVLLVGCGGKKDECTQVKDKMRPVFVAMFKDAGKSMPGDQLEKILGEMCAEKDASESSKKFYKCVLAAPDQAAAAACFEAEMKAFRDDISDIRKESADRRAEADKEIEKQKKEIEKQIAANRDWIGDAGAPAAPADAKPVASGPPVTPVDLATLPAWDIPKGVKATGPATTVYVADIDGGRLFGLLATSDFLMLPVDKKLTGRVDAKSQSEAAAAVAAQLGVEPKTPKLSGRGATVDLQFSGAPVADLMRLFGDVGHANVVMPGDLGKIDIRVKRRPWDAVMNAVIALVGRKLERNGNTYYVLAPDAKLPALPKLAKNAVVDVDVNDATVGHVVAALRKVTDFSIDACGTTKLKFRLRRVTVSEVARAMEVLGGAPLAAATPCPAKEFDGTDRDNHKLVVIVNQGTKRAVAFDHKGEIVVATKGGKILDIGQGYVTFDTGTNGVKDEQSLQLYPPWGGSMPEQGTTEEWVAAIRRTAGLVRFGKDWGAFFERIDGKETTFYYYDPKRPYGTPMSMMTSPGKIDESGAEFEIDYRKSVTLPLAK